MPGVAAARSASQCKYRPRADPSCEWGLEQRQCAIASDSGSERDGVRHAEHVSQRTRPVCSRRAARASAFAFGPPLLMRGTYVHVMKDAP